MSRLPAVPDQPDGPTLTAILFDADGVILDSEKLWDRAQEEFARHHGVRYERAKIKALLAGRSQTEGVEILKAEYRLTGDTASLVQERLELVKREYAQGVEFVPGFVEFFESIRRDHRTCIATSMPEELLTIVDAQLELSVRFGGRIFTPRDVGGRSKPAPDLFLHAARQLGVAPEHCLVIEDAPNGIEAARRAGMRCVALTTTFDRATLVGADRVVDSFTAIDLAAI